MDGSDEWLTPWHVIQGMGRGTPPAPDAVPVTNSDTIPDACRRDCTAARCGDGVVDTGETCDDGNTADGDGCAADCTGP